MGVADSHAAMNYLDFELEIGLGAGREYPVAVVRSPAGEARETMRFPFDELALENRLKDLQIALLRSGGKHRKTPLPEEQAIEDFGRVLFDTLVAGDAFFNQGEYAKAKNQYKQARSYKTDDRYVANRIQECNNRLTPKQETAPTGMVLIRGGSFLTGSNKGKDDEMLVNKIYVDAFYMDKYEVTVAQYALFLQMDPSQTKPNYWSEQLKHSNRPVVFVSWEEATAFCTWLSKQRGKRVRLPTEAEWEYAARGGLPDQEYPWGDEISVAKANYNVDGSRLVDWENTKRYLKDVDSFSPNDFGLYNMAGNVWEWCADWYGSDYYKTSPLRNPPGPTSGTLRVLRGGSCLNVKDFLRCADRGKGYPSYKGGGIGFRCAQDVP